MAMMSVLMSMPERVASATVAISSAAADSTMIRMSVRFMSLLAKMHEPYTIPIKDPLMA